MKIFCDSACDMQKDELEKLGITQMDFPFAFDGDEVELSFNSDADYAAFYKQIRSGKTPSTAGINPFLYEEFFSPTLSQGEDILYIHLSSGLTGTFSYVPQIIHSLKEKFPDRKVVFVDSKSVTMAIGLMLQKAAQLQDEGKTIDEIANQIEELKNHIACYFAPENLFYLQKGGRISLAAAIGGTLLNVKPICKSNDEGKIVKIGMVPGKKAAIKKLFLTTKENMRDSDLPIVVMHADNKEDAYVLEQMLRSEFPNKEILIRNVGPTIGTYAGPGTLATVFYADKK